MSRHTFAGHAGTTVTIGWDRPLGTFFVEVLRPHPAIKGEDETVEWHGTEPGEVPTAAAAIAIAARFADLPIGLGATLETERLKTLATSDGVAQLSMKALIRKSRH